jgi:hypothetical protein
VARSIPEVPPELIKAGATGHLVVLVGAGASIPAPAKLPSWGDLLERLRRRALNDPPTPERQKELSEVDKWFESKGELLEKASFLRQTMGADWIARAITAEFSSIKASPSEIHRELARLPGTAFITTNYDQLLEQALEERTGRRPDVVLLSDINGIKDFTKGQVLKLHGDLTAPETLVLAAEDYFHVLHQAAKAWRHKLQQMLQPPFQMLLVGYGYGDVDLQDVVDELRAAYGKKLEGPFWLETRTIQKNTKAKALGLRPIWLADFSQLVDWLKALTQAINEHKDLSPAMIRATVYVDKVQEQFRTAQRQAGKLFEQQEFEKARIEFQRLLTEAEELRHKDPESVELKRLVASCRLNIGCCLICLQELQEAREVLAEVAGEQLEPLPPEGRAILAMALVQIGEQKLARAVLPPDETQPRVREARQLIELIEGRLPGDDLCDSRMLKLARAQRLLELGQLAEAAREACALLQGGPQDMLETMNSLITIEKALRESIWEQPGAVWVPPAERGAVVQALESGLARLEVWPSLSEPLKLSQIQLKALIYDLLQDRERAHSALEALGQWKQDFRAGIPDNQLAYEQASKLAQEGRLNEALEKLPIINHPWVQGFERLQLLAQAKRYEQALIGILALSAQWPGRAPIEHLAASLLARSARLEEALERARAAFSALPGRGYRLLLAECLLKVGRSEEARAVLDELAAAPEPGVLRLRALAIEHMDPQQALHLWERYLSSKKGSALDTAQIRLHMAELLFPLGQNERAADQAWRAFELAHSEFNPEHLFRCAQFLRLGHGLNSATQTRIREIIQTIEKRFPGDREAERFRFSLLAALGFPEDIRPPDAKALVELGALRPIPLDTLKEALWQQQAFRSKVYSAYKSGVIPFESLCELTDTAAATWFIRLSEGVQEDIALCPPVGLDENVLILSLDGRRILAGMLELLLLQHLELLSKLRDALGAKGRLVIFRDVWEQVVEEAANLEYAAQRAELERLEGLIGQLDLSPKVRLEEKRYEADDPSWAQQQRLPLITNEIDYLEDGTRISPRSLVKFLLDEGHIERERGNSLLQALTPEADSPSITLELLSARVGITFAPLMTFHQAGALDALLSAIGESLVISPRTHALLKERRLTLMREVQAAELAIAVQRTVGAGISAGWIEAKSARPTEIPGLPPAFNQSGEALFRKPLARALSFRQKLREDPELILLTADYIVSAPFGVARQAVLSLHWPSHEALAEMTMHMRVNQAKVVHLPALVSLLETGLDARRKLEKLTELGFVDALRAGDTIDLARRYSGLDKVLPTRILDRVEWMFRQPEHVAAPMASMRIASVYAEAIWDAFMDASQSKPLGLTESEAQGLTNALLARAERVDQSVPGGLLDALLVQVGLKAASDWMKSYVRDPDNKVARISPDTAPGRLWFCLRIWARTSGKRRAAFDRALRMILVDIDKFVKDDRVRDFGSRALLQSAAEDPRGLKIPALETLIILSASRGPSTTADEIDAQLVRWAKGFGDPNKFVALDEEHFAYSSQAGDRLVSEMVAPEAILMRATGKSFTSLARELARLQGPHDGRAYELLVTLAERPDDLERRIEYARMTVVAPWRLIRQDPVMIRAWSWRRHFGEFFFPTTLDDLCRMLSEPLPLHLGERNLRDILKERLAEEGAWGSRLDRETLFFQTFEVPGRLPAFMAYPRLNAEEEEYKSEVMKSLRHLDGPEDVPAARLAGDIFFLRLAAARRPYVSLPGREVDLREELPARFLHVLRVVAKAGDEGSHGTSGVATTQAATEQAAQGAQFKERAVAHGGWEVPLARVEAGLLRMCLQVVIDLAGHQHLPSTEALWLTYRLFQWLWAQLEVLSLDERASALTAFDKVVPPQRPLLAPYDTLLLNPFRFRDDGFNHRLAAVLLALSEMEVLPDVFPPGEYDSPMPSRNVSSAPLEELLAKLASRPISAEERRFRRRGAEAASLNWGASGVIPDLALTALLSLNNEAFIQLSPEQRLRWILELPRVADDPDALDPHLVLLLLRSLMLHARKLSAEEKVAFEQRLRSIEVEPRGPYRLPGLAALYEAGQLHLEQEVRQMLLENLGQAGAAEACGSYLSALSFFAPERLSAEAEHILRRAEEQGLDPVPLAQAVGQVFIRGEPGSIPAAQAVLRKLAERSPYKGDERVRELLGTLGML